MTEKLENLFGLVILMSFPILLAVCIITPEKTNSGYYTDVFSYWTDTQYYCENFNPGYCKGINNGK